MPDFGPYSDDYGQSLPKELFRDLTKGGPGDMGPSLQKRMSDSPTTKFASEGDDLRGKIGPIIGAYDPEGAARMTGEWG